MCGIKTVGHILKVKAADFYQDLTEVTCGMWINGSKTYQVVVASSSCHYVRHSSLAFPDESHKLEDDPGVMLHLVH